MTENFNALIREAREKISCSDFRKKLSAHDLAYRQFSPSRLNSESHKWIWAYMVCKALDIPGDVAYKALLADRGLLTDNIRTLIKEAPDCFLYGYAFYGLRVQQLLLIADESDERENIIREAYALTTKAKKIITFFDDLELTDQRKAMLFLRFFEMNTKKEAAGKLNYAIRWAGRLQQSGLKIVSESAEKYDE